MSTVSLTIKEAKIVNSDYDKPRKIFDDNTKEFKYFEFSACPTLSKKQQNGEWESKFMKYRCIIWNEKLADNFLSNFSQSQKNYITTLNAPLTNFHTEEINKTSNNGRDYKVQVYSYLTLMVSSFVITHRAIEEDQNNQPIEEKPQPQTDTAEKMAKLKSGEVDDQEIPF